MSDKCPNHVRRRRGCPICERISAALAESSFAATPGSPEIITKGQPIDYELCELLGDKPAEFVVLCFDGVQLEDFGTPYDTPRNRANLQSLVARLNDRSTTSMWPELWRNWKPNICKQFGLPETTTSDQYSPVVSCKISRVVHGYSEHLHAAIGLFETLSDKIESWSVTKGIECRVKIDTKNGRTIWRDGDCPSLVIAEAVRDLLKANQENDKLCGGESL